MEFNAQSYFAPRFVLAFARRFVAIWMSLLGVSGGGWGSLAAQSLPDQTTTVSITTREERTTLNRATRRLESRVQVEIRNTGDRPLLPPLHVLLPFEAANGGALQDLTVPGALGGIGQEPHAHFYFDLSAAIGAGLAVDATTAFTFTFERPQSLQATYAVRVLGQRNRDPSVVLGGPYAGQQGVSIQFDGSGTIDPDGDETVFAWEFGDGGTATGAVAKHVYVQPGLFTATLRVTDAKGAEVSRQTQVPVYPAGAFALARVRTLDGGGHPLGGVAIFETGPDGQRQMASNEETGFVSLGTTAGAHRWRFEAPGYLTVHRTAELAAGRVAVVPYPWLARLTAPAALAPLQDTELVSPSERVRVTLPAGALGPAGEAALTELHGQSLPLPLPAGWSPLAAFHLHLSAEALADLPMQIMLPEAVTAWRQLVLARLDETASAPAWRCADEWPSDGSSLRQLVLRQPGSYALVLADALPAGNPPAAITGEPLAAGAAPVIALGVTASGAVNPVSAIASRDSDLVTGEATVTFANAGQPLASGAWFAAEVEETYDLLDGRALKTPDYDTGFHAYQHPGNTGPAFASARFPLRPRVLFGPEELSEAKVTVQVRGPDAASGGVITNGGGMLSAPGIRLTVPTGAVEGFAAAHLRALPTASLARFSGGVTPLLAFDLSLPPLAPGKTLGLEFTGAQTANAFFVLARCVTREGESGLQPVLRLQSDAQGRLTSAEPGAGPRLSGVGGSGQFVLMPVTGPRALVTGVVKQADASPQEGALVRVIGEPWLVISGEAGAFKLLSPPGTASIGALHPPTLHSGQAEAALADAAAVASVEVVIGARGPRVVAISPADGATKVRLVEPIILTFSIPVLPGTLVADGALELRKSADSTPVPGSLVLARGNREARFLPANPLDAGTAYTVRLAATVEGVLGLPMEGEREFEFTTQSPENRGSGAQLVIYEPDAENVPQAILDQLVGYDPEAELSLVVAHGSPGTADPQVPVLLVNETTGMTSTVLSKSDGSFANFLRADEEDFVSAVFVNANGTRVSVPASRQLYDDGRVGLYNGGGILEAESDGGPVQVIVKPGSLKERAVFGLESLDVSELLDLLAGLTPQEGGKVVGGFRLSLAGDALEEPVKVAIPARLEDLDLPPGTSPDEATFALASKETLDGVEVFRVHDKMIYEDGKLNTTSPPFSGLNDQGTYLGIRIAHTRQVVVSGSAIATDGPGHATSPTNRPLPGAVITLNNGNFGLSLNRRMIAGQYVSVAGEDGRFALFADPSLREDTGFVLSGISTRLPGVIGFGKAIVSLEALELGGRGNVYFDRSQLGTVLAADRTPPRVTVEIDGRGGIADRPLAVRVTAADSSQINSISAEILNSNPEGVLSFTAGSLMAPMPGTLATREFVFNSGEAVTATVEFIVTDSKGNTARVARPLELGRPPPEAPETVPDPFDFRGPYVLNSWPVDGDQTFDRYRPIILQFNEPVRPLDTSPSARAPIILSPLAGDPVVVMSQDRTTMFITYPAIQPDTNYRLQLVGSKIRDENGNEHDQNLQDPDSRPSRWTREFALTFGTTRDFTAPLDIDVGGGAQVIESNVFALERRAGVYSPTGGGLVTHAMENGALSVVSVAVLPPFPRALVAIPDWSYLWKGSKRLNRNLIAVTGGLVGDGVLPWLRVYDVTTPASPELVSSALLPPGQYTAVSKLAWSPPILGLLELSENSQVHYVDLQLMIHARDPGLVLANEPPNGDEGLDVDGSGDYTGDGERIPRPRGTQLQNGLINGGLVASFRIEDKPSMPISDFALEFGGRFLGIVTDREPAVGGAKPRYQTLVAGGLPVAASYFEFEERARRVQLVFGVTLREINGASRPANLVLVSHGNSLSILDVTFPLLPPSLIDRIIFAQGEQVHSATRTPSGLISVATDRRMFLFDPVFFGSGSKVGISFRDHPGLRHLTATGGTPGYAYHADGAGFYATSLGGNSLVLGKEPLNTMFTVRNIDFLTRTPPVPPSGPFGVGAPGKIRYPQDGFIEIVVEDKQKREDAEIALAFSKGDIKSEDLSKKAFIDFKFKTPKPLQDFEMKPFSAVIDPSDLTPPLDFPTWVFGPEPKYGRNVLLPIPRYSGPRPLQTPVGDLPLQMWDLSTFQPDRHQILCDNKSIRVNVYPSQEQKVTINFGKFLKGVQEAAEFLNAIGAVGAGPVKGEMNIRFLQTVKDIKQADNKRKPQPPNQEPPKEPTKITLIPPRGNPIEAGEVDAKLGDLDSISFGFGNAFKECDDPSTGTTHRVFLTYEANAEFSPLMKGEGKIEFKYIVPTMPVFNVKATIGLNGEVGGTLNFKMDQNNNRKECSTVKGKIGVYAGLKPSVGAGSLELVSVEFKAESGLSTQIEVCTDFETKIDAKGKLDFAGIKGTATFGMLAGTFTTKLGEVVLADPQVIYDNTNQPLVIYEFE